MARISQAWEGLPPRARGEQEARSPGWDCRGEETRQHPRARSQGGKWGNDSSALPLDLGGASPS